MPKKEEKSLRDKGMELGNRIADSIYDRIPVEVVEHLGKANKEMVFAIESMLNGFIERIDNRVDRVKSRHAKLDKGQNPDEGSSK